MSVPNNKHSNCSNSFLYNKTNQMHQLPKFTPAWNSTCFGQFLCPSSGVYSLYIQQWYMSYRFVDSFRAGAYAVYKPVWHIPLLSVQWINSWWWTEELSETCRVSCQNKLVKLMHLAGFIIKKSVTMRGLTNVKKGLDFFPQGDAECSRRHTKRHCASKCSKLSRILRSIFQVRTKFDL
jgi:hypothetical protein